MIDIQAGTLVHFILTAHGGTPESAIRVGIFNKFCRTRGILSTYNKETKSMEYSKIPIAEVTDPRNNQIYRIDAKCVIGPAPLMSI
ncbi:MAG: hypothetical protein V3T88_03190 [Nitrosomonadaceae bacterium]